MSRRAAVPVAAVLVALLGPVPAAAGAQEPAARDTLRLGALRDEAVRRDPRGRQLDLLASQSALRLRSLDAERLPSLGVQGQAQYQSDVVTIPFELPGGVRIPAPHRDSYDAYLGARQPLYDPTLGARRGVERATLAESQSRVRASLYEVRRSVDDAYFTALARGVQGAELRAGIVDIEARRRVASERVREGAALPGEVAALEAELLGRRQQLAQLAAEEEVARTVLGELTGRAVGPADALALPDLGAEVARARASLGELRARPEYERYARSRELLDRQREAAAAQDRPRLSAFGRAGYGRPGLNPLASRFHSYWLGGVQLEWVPWSWGATRRVREELGLQEEIVASEEAAFTEGLRRGVVGELAAMDRLEGTLAADDSIVALREEVVREARLRYDEAVITSAEYVDRETELVNARLSRATHRVELARARARFLTLVGLEVP